MSPTEQAMELGIRVKPVRQGVPGDVKMVRGARPRAVARREETVNRNPGGVNVVAGAVNEAPAPANVGRPDWMRDLQPVEALDPDPGFQIASEVGFHGEYSEATEVYFRLPLGWAVCYGRAGNRFFRTGESEAEQAQPRQIHRLPRVDAKQEAAPAQDGSGAADAAEGEHPAAQVEVPVAPADPPAGEASGDEGAADQADATPETCRFVGCTNPPRPPKPGAKILPIYCETHGTQPLRAAATRALKEAEQGGAGEDLVETPEIEDLRTQLADLTRRLGEAEENRVRVCVEFDDTINAIIRAGIPTVDDAGRLATAPEMVARLAGERDAFESELEQWHILATELVRVDAPTPEATGHAIIAAQCTAEVTERFASRAAERLREMYHRQADVDRLRRREMEAERQDEAASVPGDVDLLEKRDHHLAAATDYRQEALKCREGGQDATANEFEEMAEGQVGKAAVIELRVISRVAAALDGETALDAVRRRFRWFNRDAAHNLGLAAAMVERAEKLGRELGAARQGVSSSDSVAEAEIRALAAEEERDQLAEERRVVVDILRATVPTIVRAGISDGKGTNLTVPEQIGWLAEKRSEATEVITQVRAAIDAKPEEDTVYAAAHVVEEHRALLEDLEAILGIANLEARGAVAEVRALAKQYGAVERERDEVRQDADRRIAAASELLARRVLNVEERELALAAVTGPGGGSPEPVVSVALTYDQGLEVVRRFLDVAWPARAGRAS